MISLESIAKSFEDLEILRDISFSIAKGERASLIGPGGCGKSTILKIILGLLRPDAGSVTLFGTDMANASENAKQLLLRRVGMAFQQGALFDDMTIRENLFFAMENMTDLTASAMLERAQKLLAGVKLVRTLSMYPYELSGGMQRRVGIVRALSTEPEVAIFDEPTSGLDPVTSTIILNMIGELQAGREDVTSLVATSSVEVAIRFAKRIIVVNEGCVVADGDWRELLLNGPEWVRHFLGVRLIGLDREYADQLALPAEFIAAHW